MTKDIKVAFSGARRASSFFKAFQSHPETEIVALCDPHAETLAETERATGITQLYGDYFEVMDFVDAVQERALPAIDIHTAMDMTLPGLVSQESIRRGGEWLEVPDSRTW